MPKYVSVNDEERYYPELGLLIAPNATVTLDKTVDAAGLEPVTESAKKKSAIIEEEPATDVAPAQGE